MTDVLVPRPVTIRVTRSVATCECGTTFTQRADGGFEVSPHLRAAHGFEGEIDFETVSHVICPPMIQMQATERRSA